MFCIKKKLKTRSFYFLYFLKYVSNLMWEKKQKTNRFTKRIFKNKIEPFCLEKQKIRNESVIKHTLN